MVPERIAEHAMRTPGAEAIASPGRSITYAELDQDLNRLARRLTGLGLPKGAVVGIWVKDAALHLEVIIAASRLGLISFSFLGNAVGSETDRMVRPDRIVTDDSSATGDPRLHLLDPSWRSLDASPLDVPLPESDDPSRILISSGVTGEPKQILRTHAMLEERVQDLVRVDLPPKARVLSLFRPLSGLGYNLPLAALMQGGTVLVTDAYNWEPRLWDLRPNLIAGAPSHLQRILLTLPNGFEPDPDLRIITGGALTPRALQRAIRERLTPNLRVRYGASEVGNVAQSSAEILDVHETAAGKLLADAEVEIVDDSDRPVARGEAGRIRIRTPSMVHGYRNNEAETRRSFKDGWFYPGDVGFLTDDDVLVLGGRESHALNISGVKIAPEVVEQLAMEVTGVLDAAAFVRPGQLGVPALWVAIVRGPGYDQAKLLELLRGRIPIRPIVAAEVRRIPRNPAGKIQRALLPKLTQESRRPPGRR